MIYVTYQARLGNNLFQYSLAKILSKKYDQLIDNPFDNTIIDTTTQIGRSTNFPKGFSITDDTFADIDNNELLHCNIHINGFFQNRKMIQLLEENLNLFNNNYDYIDGLFVHVRLGDLLVDDPKRIPTYEYYADTISDNKKNINYISTDSKDHPMVLKLIENFNLTLYDDTPENTIKFASRFTHKILSFGTFSWWIGFLGCNNKIFCPDQSRYPRWHGNIYPIREWITIQK
jgi:hypothetical protein